MSGRSAVKSAFENLRPTILREPARSTVTPEAEARLLDRPVADKRPVPEEISLLASHEPPPPAREPVVPMSSPLPAGSLLQKKNRERLLLVSFRMPQGLKEKLERAAKKHEVNQTDLINEAIELNLQRYI